MDPVLNSRVRRTIITVDCKGLKMALGLHQPKSSGQPLPGINSNSELECAAWAIGILAALHHR